MTGPITPEMLDEAGKASREVLTKPYAPVSVRVGAGLSLLWLIGLRENPGRFELCHPDEHQETSDVWDALHDPLVRLAALAESNGIDSTPLRQIDMARYLSELDDVEPLVDRLELIECGPNTGETARLCARIRGMLSLRSVTVVKRARAGVADALTRADVDTSTLPVDPHGELGSTSGTELESFTPTLADRNILEALAGASTTLIQVDIEQASGQTTRTVKDRLPILEQAKLVNRPHGERRGYAITDTGRQVIARGSAR